FCVILGLDGSGKTTLARHLAEHAGSTTPPLKLRYFHFMPTSPSRPLFPWPGSADAPDRMTRFLRSISLTHWIFIAMLGGLLLGWAFPTESQSLKVVSNMFLKMIKCILVPLVFGTLVVGIAVWLSTLPFVWTWPLYPGYALAMLLIAAVLMSALGLLAGLWADKWDQLSLFQSFLINPLSFLAGVFYSVQSLEEPWKSLAHGNPFFFMIDGLRWAFFGVSDAAAALDFAVSLGFCVTISLLCWLLLARGWRIRH
ncbi:MAG: hypothetical protein EBX90_03255, partial [Betaproteobacteria bacterium]|nr:hypothetical protein [Betaproteobacteria bacterium]